MNQAAQTRRLILLAVLIVAAFVGLGYRLVDLQVLDRYEQERAAENNTERTIMKRPHRGDIRSVRGDLLATSLPAVIVYADPSLILDRYIEMAKVLAPVLRLDVRKLAERLQPRILRYETNGTAVTPVLDQYVVLKHKVTLDEWAQVRAALAQATFGLNPEPKDSKERERLRVLRTIAIQTNEDEIRFYPNGRLAAHVLGFTGDNDSGTGLIGRNGIEWNWNDQLTGVAGWREIERDRRGHELVPYRRQDVAARDGYDVYLTIDAVLQQTLESEMADAMERLHPKSIAGVMVRPQTGEILALANLPNFDPNLPGTSTDDSRRNRVIADIVEPGSTFKIVVVSGALNDHAVTLSDVFDCEHGAFHFGGRVLHDHRSYGRLTVEQIITKSSNIGAAKIGIKLGPERLYQYIRDFGFGSRTGIALPGEVVGIVHPVKDWSKVSIAQLPMGQGIAVTRLQMLMAMATIANHGLLMRPMIVDHVADAQGNVVAQYSPQPVRQVIRPETAELMIQALTTVPTPEGTAPKAALAHYTVAGKTGTAQKPNPAGGYYSNHFVASFIGFLPAEHPAICLAIFVDDPPAAEHYGGVCAAPIFHSVAERAASYLNLRPDKGDPIALTEATQAAAETPATQSTAARNARIP